LGTSCRLEVFASPAANASSHGEGKTFLGAFTFVVNATTIPIAVVLCAPGASGQVISVTLTDSNNNTSEFSNDVTVH
jgi:hypothetical protein